MSEDVYAIPDLTKKARYGRGEREEEMEERGEREERIVDIYVTADDLDLDPGTQQDAVQKNTAQEQNEGSDQSKNNHSRANAVCLVLLSLLLAVIIGLVIKYSELIAENNNLNAEKNNLIAEKNNLVKDLDQIQFRYNNMTEQKGQIQSSFDLLQSSSNNLTKERDKLKRMLFESHGWQQFASSCYYISNQRKTWEASRQYCIDRQSDLMVVNSKEKEDFIERVTCRYQNMWLGLTDRAKEGVWKWVDGTPLTTPTYWVHGEPDSSLQNEDCAVFWNGDNKGWYDKPCNENIHWICERVC